MARWILLLSLSLFLSACTQEEEEPSIKLGTLFSVTGGLAGLGNDLLNASQLAVDEINAAGGVLGQPLELVNQDEGSQEDKAAAAAQRHLDGEVSAVVGAFGSAFTLAAANILTDQNVVMVSPGSTSPALTTYEDNGFLFRTVPSDALQGKLLAQKALGEGFQTAAITHVTGAYGEGLADTFKQDFEAGGGTVGFVEEYVDGQSSYTDLLTRALADDPDALVLIVYPQEGAQMIQDFNTGFANKNVFVYFADSAANDDFITLAGGSNAFGFPHLGTAPSSEGPNYAGFAQRYQARFGEVPSTFQANAYDAVYLIALAMIASGSTDGTAIRDSLTAVSSGGTRFGPSEFAAAVTALGNGEDIDYHGVSGDLDFDAAGDIVAPYALWKIENGQVTITGTELPE